MGPLSRLVGYDVGRGNDPGWFAMSKDVSIEIERAAAGFERLFDALENAGISSIILTRDGRPAARLVPADLAPPATQTSTNDGVDEAME